MLDTRFADQKLRACILAARAAPKPIQENPARSDRSLGQARLESTLAETCGATPIKPAPVIEWVSAQDVAQATPQIRRGTTRVGTIVNAAAHHFDLPINDILSQRRQMRFVRPRHIAMYLSHELTTLSYPQIGHFMGDRDHTTVLNAVQKIERLILVDQNLGVDIAAIRALAMLADPGLVLGEATQTEQSKCD